MEENTKRIAELEEQKSRMEEEKEQIICEVNGIKDKIFSFIGKFSMKKGEFQDDKNMIKKEIARLHERFSKSERKLSDFDKFHARFADVEGKLKKEKGLVTMLENDLKIE